MKKILKIIDLISKNRKNIYFKVPEKKVILLNSTRYNQAKYTFDSDIENNLFILPTHLNKSFKLFISFRIIYYFFFYYKKSSSVYESYFSACIKCLKARVVLDYSKYGFILNISKNFPKVNFVVVCDRVKRKISKNIDADFDYLEFLENYFKKNNEKIKNVYLFLRSERDKRHFEEMGLEQNKTGLEYYVIGSFLADYVRENFYEDKKKIRYFLFLKYRYIPQKN